MEIFLVGGAVRDKQLGLPVKDRDWVVVGASVDTMLAQGYQQVGKDFPVFLHPRTKEEYALARTERKRGHGYKGFEVHAAPDVTLEQDLLRRDLTINAMAEDQQGRLIDPHGGLEDLRQRLLRHVSPAFAEDPLRVLRTARFAARFASMGFTVAPATLSLMREIVDAGEIEHLVAERVWQEIQAAMASAAPQVFIQVLRDCGALARLLPEVDALFGVPQPAKYHPEIDTGLHTLLVLEQAAKLSPEPRVRFAALLHDLGKAVTPRDQWPSHIGHEHLGAALVEQVCQRLRAPNDYRDLARLTCLYHTHCHRAGEHRAKTLLATLEHLDAFRRPERFEEFLLACEADCRGRTGLEQVPYPQPEILRKALNLACQVEVKAILGDGFKQAAIGEELKKRRIRMIREGLNLKH